MRASRIALITTAILIGFTDFSFSQDVKYRSSLEVEGICEDCIKAQLKVSGDVDNVSNQSRDLARKVNIFEKDTREQQSRRGPAKPYAAIGSIATVREIAGNNGVIGRGYGTAFMVSPCLALTNYHVVFGQNASAEVIPAVVELGKQMEAFRESKGQSQITLPNDRNYTMVLSIGENADGSFKRRAVGVPVAFGEDSYDSIGRDWTLVEFSPPNCPGEDPEIGWLEFASMSTDELLNASVHTAGYPGDLIPEISNKMPLFRSGECRLREFLGGGAAFGHDCPTRPGQSGSPLLVMINGRLKVVAMHKGPGIDMDGVLPKYEGKTFDERTTLNRAVDVRYFLPGIKRRIDRDINAYYQRHANEDRVIKADPRGI